MIATSSLTICVSEVVGSPRIIFERFSDDKLCREDDVSFILYCGVLRLVTLFP